MCTCTCPSEHLVIRGQLGRTGSLLPCGSWIRSSRHQAWQHELLLTGPSHTPLRTHWKSIDTRLLNLESLLSEFSVAEILVDSLATGREWSRGQILYLESYLWINIICPSLLLSLTLFLFSFILYIFFWAILRQHYHWTTASSLSPSLHNVNRLWIWWSR